MVHTVELTVVLTKYEYDFLRSKGDSLYSWLSRFGIRGIVASKQKMKNSSYTGEDEWRNYSYHCKMRVNLARVANDGQPTIELFINKHCNIDSLYENFSKFVSLLLPSKSNLQDWNVTRIDYCINIYTPYVEAYIKLFQKGDKPSKIEIPDSFVNGKSQNKAPDKRTHRNGSVYYQNGSTGINIYDKYKQRKAEMLESGYYNETELEKCRNILRFEVQCKYPRTYNMKIKHEMITRELYEYLRIPKEVKSIFTRYYKTVCGLGNYYSYDKACELVEESLHHKKQTKADMLQVLELINGNRGTRSVYKAEARYTGKMKYDKVLDALGKMAVNPVTLRNPKSDNDLSILFSLYSTIVDYCQMLEEEDN